MRTGYLAFNLTDAAREEILSLFKPQFDKVVCHHITFKFGVKESEPIPDLREARVIGYAANKDIECLVVEIGGTYNRPDGSIYHITLSHSPNAKPVDSNALLKSSGFNSVDPLTIGVVPTFNPF